MMPLPRSRPPRYLALLFALSAAAAPLQAQDAAELIRRASALQVERLAQVEDLTITQEVMGMETVAHMEKREVDGVPTLVTVSIRANGMSIPVTEESNSMSLSGAIPEEWAQRVRLVGTDQVDGRPVHVLVIDDFTGLTFPSPPSGGAAAGDFHPSSMRFTLEEGTLLMRTMETTGELRSEGAPPTPFEMQMEATDYREVQGYWHPHRTRMVTRGALAVAGTDTEEIRAQVAQMRDRLDGMPADQRAMVESMILPQIERLEAMLGDDGAMEVVLTVTNLQVNTGGR